MTTEHAPRPVRAALRMGVAWAIAWAPVGILIALIFGGNSWISDGRPLDDWFMPLVLLGLIGGAAYSASLPSGDRIRLLELSPTSVALRGVLVGLLVGCVAVFAWSNDAGYGPIIWERAGLMVMAATILGTASALATHALTRAADRTTHAPEDLGTLGES